MPRTATETTTKKATKSANAKTKSVEGKTKAKRAPSAYNIYMAKHLKEWKEENPGKPIKEGMAAVAALWRNAPENPKRGQEPAARAPKKSGKENTKKSKKEVTSEEEAEGSE